MNHTDFAHVPLMRQPDPSSGRLYQKFKRLVEAKHNAKIDNVFDLHKWSVQNIQEFWREMWSFLGIISSKKFEQVVDLKIPMRNIPKWFEGARLNYAENLLKYRDEGTALVCLSEEVHPEKISYSDMYKETQKYAAAFRKFGLRKGDIVACYLPNRKEAVFAMLAAVSIGATLSGALPISGPQAVLSRLKQVNPRVLLTIDRFLQNKEEREMLSKVKEIAESLPSLEKILIISTRETSDISQIRNSCFLHDFLETGREENGQFPDLVFEQVSFSHPVMINFTSGTTGKPKAILHGFATLIPSVMSYGFHLDSDRDSIWLSMSPVGWVSWNMIMGLLFFGCTIVLFEGDPYFLTPTYFWGMVQNLQVTHLFLPTSIGNSMQKFECVPAPHQDLSKVQVCLLGGSVVKPQLYDFFYNHIKKDMLFGAIYGTTEIMGLCLQPDLTAGLYKGELPMPSLGFDLHCVNEEGKVVEGELGELVIGQPHPGLMLGLWKDEDGSLLREAYFSRTDGKFSMNDFAIVNPVTKGFIICGRSDDTIKQFGNRFVSSEIYLIVELMPEIQDSVCVSQYNKDLDERAVLFVKMKKEYTFNEQLVEKIRQTITTRLTPSHVPQVILETKDIPYNTSWKKMEKIVKNIINNRPYNAETIINADCLQYFQNVPELGDF